MDRTYSSTAGVTQVIGGKSFSDVTLEQKIEFTKEMISFFDSHDLIKEKLIDQDDVNNWQTTTGACAEGAACYVMSERSLRDGENRSSIEATFGVMTDAELIGNAVVRDLDNYLETNGFFDPIPKNQGGKTPVAYFNDLPSTTKDTVVEMLSEFLCSLSNHDHPEVEQV